MGCQYSIRIWKSGEWQTRTAECRQRSANPLPITQRVDTGRGSRIRRLRRSPRAARTQDVSPTDTDGVLGPHTIAATKAATFSIDLPSEAHKGMPFPTGTGFFVSPDGWFVTAAHVVMVDDKPRNDIGKGWLIKEMSFEGEPAMCQGLTLELVQADADFALLKVEFKANTAKAWLAGRTEFPYLSVSSRLLDEGELVYSFGYPLGTAQILVQSPSMTLGYTGQSPRVTSAIVSSRTEATGLAISSNDPQVYVLDKALNYGNSGGPIVATETGRVHAFCSHFQPVMIPQEHIRIEGKSLSIMIPSLYGVVRSLSAPVILRELEQRSIPVFDD